MKRLTLSVVVLISLVTTSGCGTKAADVTVIGNSSSQEKMVTPAPTK